MKRLSGKWLQTGSGPTSVVLFHYFIAHLGFFSWMAISVVSLYEKHLSPGQVAILSTTFIFSNKFAKSVLSPFLDKLRLRECMTFGCGLAAVCFLIAACATNIYVEGFALLIAGIGSSINTISSKQLAAAVSDLLPDRASLFSKISVSINVASATASPIALYFGKLYGFSQVMGFIGIAYALAGLHIYVRFRRAAPEVAPVSFARVSRAEYWAFVKRPNVVRFLCVNTLGWIFYGQLFGTFALHASLFNQDKALGLLFTFNALIVIFLQIPMSAVLSKYVKNYQQTMYFSFLIFAASFLFLAELPGMIGSVLFIVVFTLAEMAFMPSIDVVYLDLIKDSKRAMAYGVLGISTALGESVGEGVGVALYGSLGRHGYGSIYWLAFAGLAVLVAAVFSALGKRPLRTATSFH